MIVFQHQQHSNFFVTLTLEVEEKVTTETFRTKCFKNAIT
jgi:hypothetical protein